MKTFKIKFYVISLMALFTITTFFTSCEQEELVLSDTSESIVDEPSSYKHSKDMEILSENGLNKIVISAFSDDKSLLDNIHATNYKIVPVFEKPTETINHASDDGAPDESADALEGPKVAFQVGDIELEEGAIGYTIEVEQTNLNRNYISHTWYTSKNSVYLRYRKGCFIAHIFAKLIPQGGYHYGDSKQGCNGYTTRFNANIHLIQLKVNLRYKNSNNRYSVYFYDR